MQNSKYALCCLDVTVDELVANLFFRQLSCWYGRPGRGPLGFNDPPQGLTLEQYRVDTGFGLQKVYLIHYKHALELRLR